jgi:hypothetical protein
MCGAEKRRESVDRRRWRGWRRRRFENLSIKISKKALTHVVGQSELTD